MLATPVSAVSTPPADRLAVLQTLSLETGTVTLVERDEAAALTFPDGAVFTGLPPRTKVKLVLNPAQGSNINVEIWLPDAGRWNGRYLGLGNGGAAGHLPLGSLARAIPGGYAVATTDMGTAPDAASGIGNREVWKDFGFRATHLMTVAAKRVIEAYYGRLPEYSYFNGGSTGGQQALQEAQRYPGDYDGIVAYIPAHCRTPLHAYFLWNAQILHRCPFTEAQQKNVIAAGVEHLAARETPVTAGKVISDPRCAAGDIEAVVGLAMKKDPTLTPAHGEALRQLFGGPRHAVTGERIFGGIPLGASFGDARGNLYLFNWVFGAARNLMELDFGKDIDTYTAALGPYLNAENADLSRFEQRGGKLLMVSGAADACVPYHASLDYYERVAALAGGIERAKTFCRFYMIPGMAHGLGSGPGINRLPDALKMVAAWREDGVAPNMIIGQRVADGKIEWETPIFPYPEKPLWDAETGAFKAAEGTRGGVERVAERFRPAAAE